MASHGQPWSAMASHGQQGSVRASQRQPRLARASHGPGVGWHAVGQHGWRNMGGAQASHGATPCGHGGAAVACSRVGHVWGMLWHGRGTGGRAASTAGHGRDTGRHGRIADTQSAACIAAWQLSVLQPLNRVQLANGTSRSCKANEYLQTTNVANPLLHVCPQAAGIHASANARSLSNRTYR